MAQHWNGNGTQVQRRGVDPFALIVGVGALLVSVAAFTDDSGWLTGIDPRWLLAGGAVLVGTLLLVGSLRRPRRRD